MNKLIVRQACITFAGLCLCTLLVFSMWILCSPQTMASACERTGNYSFAVTCADLRYKYTKNSDDLSRCLDDSILCGKDKLVVKYGEKLIADKNFDAVCEKKTAKTNVDYKSFACGNIAYSQYRRGDFSSAVKSAGISGTEAGFIKLTVAVSEKGTAKEKSYLKDVLTELNYEKLANIL